MSNFYEEWIGLWEKAEEERAKARKVIHERELEWVETRYDARAALLLSPENGFRTWGSTCFLGEIPVGAHTGKHRHGEEAIFIVQGAGFSIVDGVRYDWKPESALLIAFGSEHQHFNTGDTTVRYFSTMAVHLEHYVGVHRTTHLENWGPNKKLPDAPRSTDGLAKNGSRVLLLEPTVDEDPGETDLSKLPEVDPSRPLVVGDRDGMWQYTWLHRPRSDVRLYMEYGKTINGFDPREVELHSVMHGPAGKYSGKHAHMEAGLYILDGEGYSVIAGERFEWEAGAAIHVPGPQTIHQHFNTGAKPSRMLRFAPGIRYWFEKSAKREFPYLLLQPRQGVAEARRQQQAIVGG
jgi:quercetin dioxygenase-like cupin family protein